MHKAIGKKIDIFGTKKEVEKAEKVLQGHDFSKMSEPEARLLIQKLIDEHNLKASILYDGNTVYSFNRIIRCFKIIKKHGVLGYPGRFLCGSFLSLPSFEGEGARILLTNEAYYFLQSCGSIAHYNKAGWVAHYPTVEHLRQFFLRNEYGVRVLDFVPGRFADRKRIILAIEELLGIREAAEDKVKEDAPALDGGKNEDD